MKVKYLGCLLLFLLILVSCERSMHSRVIKAVQINCSDSKKCQISIDKLTNFEWQKMYIFGQITTQDEISDAIGFEYNGTLVPEDENRIIFCSNNKVTQEDTWSYKTSGGSILNFIPLKDSTRQKYICYSKIDAVFNIRILKIESCNACFYYM